LPISLFFELADNFKSICQSVSAQSLCAEALTQAQKLYDDGMLVQAREKITKCLKTPDNGFTKEEKARAYRLLTLIHLYADQTAEAENSMIQMLTINPDYRLNPANEVAEFIKLYQQYRTTPIVTLGVNIGVNRNTAVSVKSFSTDTDNQSATFHSNQTGISFGISSNYHLSKSWEVSFDVIYNTRRFAQSQSLFGFTTLNITETQTMMDFPLSLGYQTGGYKLKYLVQAGVVAHYLFSSSIEANRFNFQNVGSPMAGQAISVTDMRYSGLAYSGLLGIGLRYKIPRGFLMLKGQYQYGLTNQVLPAKRYANNELLFRYGYLDDNFRLNQLTLQISYLYAFYQPKKLR